MKRLQIVMLALAAAGFLAAPASAAAALSPGIMATINGTLHAGTPAKMNSYFTRSSIVIDEFSPYTWTGSKAAQAWWAAVQSGNAKRHLTNFRATAGRITQYDVSGPMAYVVVPLKITWMQKGKPGSETGLWTLIMRRMGTSWKITTASWARTSM